MTARPFLASVRHEGAQGGLAMMRRGRWRLVLVEGNGERRRSSCEGRMRCGMLWGGPRGGFYRGRGGGERSGEVQKRLAMVGSFNGFGRFSIEGGSEEDEVGHRFEKRRAGGTVDSAALGAEESAGGIRSVATPTKGGGGCSQWCGAASFRGGRSLGGQLGRLGRTEVAGRLGLVGKPRPGKCGRQGSLRGGEGRRAGIRWRPRGRGGGSGLAWRGMRPGACWAGSRWTEPVGMNWGMNRKIDFVEAFSEIKFNSSDLDFNEFPI
jgi:hypothetical protein